MGTPRRQSGCSPSQSVSTADCWWLNILPALSCLGISYLGHLRSTESHCYWEHPQETPVQVAIPHTWQPHLACGSLDAMGSVCIALGELHTWEALLFYSFLLLKSLLLESLNQSKLVHGSHSLALSSATPHGNKPYNLPQLRGDNRPPPLLNSENKSEGTHRGQPCQRPGHPQNHIQPSHWCSSCWTLLRKHCHQPKAPLGVSLCRRVPGRPLPALWHCHASPSIIPAGWALLTITGKEQKDCCVLQHTLPALMGLKWRWGSEEHSKLNGSLLWEQSYARPASSKARSPVFPPCRIQRGPLEGCRGFLCTAFPQQRRSCRLYSTFYQGLKQWQRIFFSCPVLYKKSLPQREYLLELELLGVCPARNINY